MGISIAKYTEMSEKVKRLEKELKSSKAHCIELEHFAQECEKRMDETIQKCDKTVTAAREIICDFYIMKGKIEAYEKVLLKKDEVQ